tara:strand:+ start:383 stop:1438 length:1056 start_codon:yes stop_codon:yes gene_type:complete
MGKLHRFLLGYKENRGVDIMHSFPDLSKGQYREYAAEIVFTYINSLNKALISRSAAELHREFTENQIQDDLLPFQLEALAMGAAISDNFLPAIVPFVKRDFLDKLIEVFGKTYLEMILLGAGRGMAEIPNFNLHAVVAKYPPEVRWLIMDGYGFQKGFFEFPKNRKYIYIPKFKYPYFHRAYAQGLARSLGFYLADQPGKISHYLERVQGAEASDLWSGAGSAVAFLGALTAEQFKEWCDNHSEYRQFIAVGLALACRLQTQCGWHFETTNAYCEVLWGTSAKEITNRVLNLQSHLEATQMPDQSLYDEYTDYENLRDLMKEEFLAGTYLQKFVSTTNADPEPAEYSVDSK